MDIANGIENIYYNSRKMILKLQALKYLIRKKC